MKPVIKVNGIKDLHDARYCAAVGIELLTYPMGSNGVKGSEIREILPWLSGPKVIGSFSDEPAEEIHQAVEGLDLAYLALPLSRAGELSRAFTLPIVYYQTDEREDQLAESLQNILSGSADDLIEVRYTKGLISKIPEALHDRVLFVIEDPKEVDLSLHEMAKMPFGFTLGQFSHEENGALDYEACDAFLEQYQMLAS